MPTQKKMKNKPYNLYANSSSSLAITSLYTHPNKHTHTQCSLKSLSAAFLWTDSADCSLIGHQGEYQAFSKCSIGSRGPPLPPQVGWGEWRRGRKKGESQKGELALTQTCAGGCRGTGRRWRRTWGPACGPWSSCRPPRSAGRSLPSPCRHRWGHTKEKWVSCKDLFFNHGFLKFWNANILAQ